MSCFVTAAAENTKSFQGVQGNKTCFSRSGRACFWFKTQSGSPVVVEMLIPADVTDERLVLFPRVKQMLVGAETDPPCTTDTKCFQLKNEQSEREMRN